MGDQVGPVQDAPDPMLAQNRADMAEGVLVQLAGDFVKNHLGKSGEPLEHN